MTRLPRIVVGRLSVCRKYHQTLHTETKLNLYMMFPFLSRIEICLLILQYQSNIHVLVSSLLIWTKIHY